MRLQPLVSAFVGKVLLVLTPSTLCNLSHGAGGLSASKRGAPGGLTRQQGTRLSRNKLYGRNRVGESVRQMRLKKRGAGECKAPV